MAWIYVGIFPLDDPDAEAYPLVRSRCNVRVSDVYTMVDLSQDYESSSSNVARDVNYVFPLPPSAAVCAFKAVINDTKTIHGVVKKKGAAKKMFAAAISQGKKAALLEKEHTDVFRVSLGNIKPSDKVSVHLSYVALISHDGATEDSLRLVIPTTIGQRYGQTPTSIPPPISGNTFELNVAIQMGAPVTAISSPTHPISLTLGRHTEQSEEFTPNSAIVQFHDTMLLDKDVVIIISAKNLDRPRCFVERWLASEGTKETTDAYALTFAPKVDLPPILSQEYIFLVDRSGCMSGSRIESVKNALQIMLRSLPSRKTTFNIISFGSNNSALWKTSQVYDKNNVDMASEHVESFKADYGGTELSRALKVAYESKAPSSLEHQASTAVFVLTDGDSWDLRGVVNEVADATKKAFEQNHTLRTFVLGVGDSIAVGMCEAIARAGKAVAVFVGSKEKPDAKLVNLLRAARGGVLEDISIDWGTAHEKPTEEEFEIVHPEDAQDKPQKPIPSLLADPHQPVINLFDPLTEGQDSPELGPQDTPITLAPPPRIQQVPSSDGLGFPIYPGFRCSIYAIIRQTDDRSQFPPTVKINGKVNGKPVSLAVEVVMSGKGKDGHLIHTLAARALIEQFEDERDSAPNKAEIVRLGIRYSLATSKTSFVAIEEGNSDAVEVEDKQASESSDDDMGFGLWDDGAVGTQNLAKGVSFYDDDDDEVEEEEESQDEMERMIPRPIAVVYSRQMKEESESKEQELSELQQELSGMTATARAASLSSDPVPYPTSLPGAIPAVNTPKIPLVPALSVAAIAKVQNFDGAFHNTPETIGVLLQGKELPKVPNYLEDLAFPSQQEKDSVWITIIALVVLGNFMEERSAWGLLAAKADDVIIELLEEAGVQESAATELVEKLKREAEAIL